MRPTRRTVLGGLAAAFAGPRAARGQDQEARTVGPGIAYGWDPGIAGPTEATFHVAPDGDDHAPGTRARPFRTIQHGVDQLARQAAGSLALHEGIYREAVTLDGLRGRAQADGSPAYRLHRFGRDRVIVSAAETLGGWKPCSDAEAARLGVEAAGIFVARLPADRLVDGALLALNLHEAGIWSPVATRRADISHPEAIGDWRQYQPAEFVLSARGHIRAVRDPGLVGLDPAVMTDVRLLIYHAPNVVSSVVPDAFDRATGTFRLAADTALRPQVSAGQAQMVYALQNFAPALVPGSWVARHDGAQVAVYSMPRDPAALKGRIEVSVRDCCIDFGRARSVELFGIEAVRAAGTGRRSGVCLRRARVSKTGAEPADLRLIHCRAGENLAAEPDGFGAIFLGAARGLTIASCSVGPSRASYGLFLNDCTDVDMRQLHIHDVAKSPARFFSLRTAVLAFSLFERSGWDAHANKFNFYQGSDRILVYGVRTRATGGYVTYQKASRIHFAFCEFDCAPLSQNRALVSQNYGPGQGQRGDGTDGSGDPVPGATFWYWNLSLLPRPGALSPANSLQLGPGRGTQHHAVHNCILHGGGLADIYLSGTDPDRERRSHNVYTGLSHWQTAANGWTPGPAETKGQPFRRPSGKGLDMRPQIAAMTALFPGFADWDRDIDGNRVDWDAPPIGATV